MCIGELNKYKGLNTQKTSIIEPNRRIYTDIDPSIRPSPFWSGQERERVFLAHLLQLVIDSSNYAIRSLLLLVFDLQITVVQFNALYFNPKVSAIFNKLTDLENITLTLFPLFAFIFVLLLANFYILLFL